MVGRGRGSGSGQGKEARIVGNYVLACTHATQTHDVTDG